MVRLRDSLQADAAREQLFPVARWLHAARSTSAAACAAVCLSACSSIPFLGASSSAPGDRASRFDRFERELAMDLSDTAPAHRHLAQEAQIASVLGGDIGLDPVGWSNERRHAARRALSLRALGRLENDLQPTRLRGERASAARSIQSDLRASLGLFDPDISARDAIRRPPAEEQDPVAMTPWHGELLEAPSILARELPAQSKRDVERWIAELERIASAPVNLATVTPRSMIDTFGPRAREVASAIHDDLVRMAASTGTGDVSDPFVGPMNDAARSLPEPQSNAFAGRSRRKLLKSLQNRVGVRLSAVKTLLRQLEGQRLARTVHPLTGDRRERWAERLLAAAGTGAEIGALDRLARDEIQRLRTRLGHALALDQPEDRASVQAAFEAIRKGERLAPGGDRSPLTPESIWALAEGSLDDWIDDPVSPLVVAQPARIFERPHGRWSPFVRGDLLPAVDPGAMPSLYLAPRPRDPTTPGWLHTAEALRYGVPGEALLDGYRRTAVTTPLYLRVTEREGFAGGWGLYAAAHAVEQGLDLGDDGFGVTAQELVAFVALAVDVGLHDRGWSYSQALEAVLDWTPLPRFAAEEIVLRAICEPGRAALPAVGLLRLRALRAGIEQLLGERFDQSTFHAAVLTGGPLPLAEIDARIDRWLEGSGQ